MDENGLEDQRVGATIRALREAYGWKLGKFAIAIRTTHGHLANIEAGRKRCTPEMARRIAGTLGVPLAAITTARPTAGVVGTSYIGNGTYLRIAV